MSGLSLVTRGRITKTSDARAMLVGGYVDNTPAPPTVSQDFCPVAIRVSDVSTIGRIRVASTGATIRISNSATIIRKKC